MPATAFAMEPSKDKKKSNLRLALILASIAIVFFVGFMAKMAFFSH